jgi:hypothetical protein
VSLKTGRRWKKLGKGADVRGYRVKRVPKNTDLVSYSSIVKYDGKEKS